MRQMEYSPESDFNVSYDGKSMVITACGDKESQEIRIPPLIDGQPVTESETGRLRSVTKCGESFFPIR